MGWNGNSLSHLMLALSASLQQAALDVPSTNLNDASLQAYALMSRRLGRLMSTGSDLPPGLAGAVTLVGDM